MYTKNKALVCARTRTRGEIEGEKVENLERSANLYGRETSQYWDEECAKWEEEKSTWDVGFSMWDAAAFSSQGKSGGPFEK